MICSCGASLAPAVYRDLNDEKTNISMNIYVNVVLRMNPSIHTSIDFFKTLCKIVYYLLMFGDQLISG